MDIKAFVEANPKLVTHRESTRYPGLFILRYTRKVFYDNLWTPELEECRGLVVDHDWNPVICPFRKIYNRGERGTDFPLNQRVTAVRKVNGFMAAATYVEGHGVVVSTTGSLDSPFVTLAEAWLRPNITSWINNLGHGITWLFEICDPTDPHIIPEPPGAYLIGARLHQGGAMVNEDTLCHYAKAMGALRPAVWYQAIRFSTVLDLVRLCQHEGFVVHGPDKSLKIKSPYYLITKFLGRMQPERLMEKLDDLASLRQTVDEEFYPLLDFISLSRDHFKTLDETGRIGYIRAFLQR
jgi:hypothetical protein